MTNHLNCVQKMCIHSFIDNNIRVQKIMNTNNEY